MEKRAGVVNVASVKESLSARRELLHKKLSTLPSNSLGYLAVTEAISYCEISLSICDRFPEEHYPEASGYSVTVGSLSALHSAIDVLLVVETRDIEPALNSLRHYGNWLFTDRKLSIGIIAFEADQLTSALTTEQRDLPRVASELKSLTDDLEKAIESTVTKFDLAQAYKLADGLVFAHQQRQSEMSAKGKKFFAWLCGFAIGTSVILLVMALVLIIGPRPKGSLDIWIACAPFAPIISILLLASSVTLKLYKYYSALEISARNSVDALKTVMLAKPHVSNETFVKLVETTLIASGAPNLIELADSGISPVDLLSKLK